MYFPANYENDVSIKLGELVASAYDQYRCFQHKTEWHIKTGFTLVTPLAYPFTAKGGFESIEEKKLIEKNYGKKDQIYVPIGFIAQDGKNLYLIFRGTVSQHEWVENMHIKLVDFIVPNCGKVHDGFLDLYDSVRTQITKALTTSTYKGLFISGHSLGAALATLAALDIASNIKPIEILEVCTFGSPRVGDAVFTTSYNKALAKNTYRILNSSDLVTEIPPPAKFLGFIGSYFSHVDTPIMFNEQLNDLGMNHEMKTYLKVLGNVQSENTVIRKFFKLFT